jgi:hypothetical protein
VFFSPPRAARAARLSSVPTLLWAASVQADPAEQVPRDERALMGRSALPAADQVVIAEPTAAPIALAGTLGYALTESQSGEGAHHRIDGTLAAAVSPAREWAFSLAFDVRYDTHPDGDDSGVAAPRLAAVYVHPVRERLQLGAALGFGVPGAASHSLDFGAPVITALALGSWQLPRGIVLSGQLGLRLDWSAHAAPDMTQLSSSDRLGLGLSDFHALPIGVAALGGWGPVHVAAELSGEILVGEGAPSMWRSPLRAAIVGRLPLATGLALEGLLRVGLSARPPYDRPAPLIPVEPRVLLAVGVRFSPLAEAPPSAAHAAPSSQLAGRVHDAEGIPVADARLELTVAGQHFGADTGQDGSFALADLPLGAASLVVTADGYLPAQQDVLLDRKLVELELSVDRRVPAAQLRGLVRSFAGAALPARVRVLPAGASAIADNAGRFMLELPPGVYQVEIECRGYLPQRRRVTVQENGVTLLNVELHSVRR